MEIVPTLSTNQTEKRHDTTSAGSIDHIGEPDLGGTNNFMLSSPANGRTRVAIGDYGRRINDPRNVHMAFTIAIIDLAKRHPDHGEPVPAITYDSTEQGLDIEYHPRPDAVTPVSYILAVDELKKMPRTFWLARHFNECVFVVFDGNDPIVDGSLKFSSSDDKASERLAGDS